MSDQKDWLDETEVLLIGAWDVLGKRGPKLVSQVRALLQENEKLRAALLDAREGCIAAYDALLHLPNAEERIPSIRATMRKGIEGADLLGVNHGSNFFPETVAPKKPKPCPRRVDGGLVLPGDKDASDYFDGDDNCSYCGSLNPETFMARLEAGDVRLIPTDKNYKVYIYNEGGEQFKLWHSRTCPDVMACDRKTCEHWTKSLRNDSKFYFQHLSVEQQHRLITLYNEKKLKLGEPGNFYVLPFFMVKVP